MLFALRMFLGMVAKGKHVFFLCRRIVLHGRENIAHPLVALSQIALCCVRVVLLIKGNHFFVVTQRFLILLAEIHPHRSFIHQLEICLLLSFCLLLGLSRHVIIFSRSGIVFFIGQEYGIGGVGLHLLFVAHLHLQHLQKVLFRFCFFSCSRIVFRPFRHTFRLVAWQCQLVLIMFFRQSHDAGLVLYILSFNVFHTQPFEQFLVQFSVFLHQRQRLFPIPDGIVLVVFVIIEPSHIHGVHADVLVRLWQLLAQLEHFRLQFYCLVVIFFHRERQGIVVE